ncbi:unnamed protein product [Closterium sp. NIES-65]|nr:unnamed protein product [Closterium sp. NIES-65]
MRALGSAPDDAATARFARQRADRSAWTSRDVAACIALSSLLPESEEVHFTQVRTAAAYLTTIKARYSTPATVSLGRLFLPFLFPDLASFERSADLIAHLRSLDASYRAACTEAQLALLPPPMAITVYFIATNLPDRLASVRDALLLKHPSELTIEVLESALKDFESNLRLVAAASGTVSPPLFHGCTVPQLPTFTASLATAATDATAAAVTTASRSRGKGGKKGSSGGGGGGGSGGNGGAVATGGGGSAASGETPRAAAGDSTAPAGGGDPRARQSLPVLPTPLVTARHTTTLPCPAAPSGSLTGFHVPSFSRNLVGVRPLVSQHVGVWFEPSGETAVCVDGDSYQPLATFTAEPGSGLYTLHTGPRAPQQQPHQQQQPQPQQQQQQQLHQRSHQQPPLLPLPPVPPPVRVPASHQVASSPQVSVSCLVPTSAPVAASCSCRSLAHPTVLWHHRMGHPSLPRLRAMSSQRLVLGLPRVLPSLPPSLAPPCGPCVEGRLRAAPHSSSLRPATEPFETLHLDVWGPAPRLGPERERYFLVVVDDFSRYTTVFPLA